MIDVLFNFLQGFLFGSVIIIAVLIFLILTRWCIPLPRNQKSKENQEFILFMESFKSKKESLKWVEKILSFEYFHDALEKTITENLQNSITKFSSTNDFQESFKDIKILSTNLPNITSSEVETSSKAFTNNISKISFTLKPNFEKEKENEKENKNDNKIGNDNKNENIKESENNNKTENNNETENNNKNENNNKTENNNKNENNKESEDDKKNEDEEKKDTKINQNGINRTQKILSHQFSIKFDGPLIFTVSSHVKSLNREVISTVYAKELDPTINVSTPYENGKINIHAFLNDDADIDVTSTESIGEGDAMLKALFTKAIRGYDVDFDDKENCEENHEENDQCESEKVISIDEDKYVSNHSYSQPIELSIPQYPSISVHAANIQPKTTIQSTQTETKVNNITICTSKQDDNVYIEPMKIENEQKVIEKIVEKVKTVVVEIPAPKAETSDKNIQAVETLDCQSVQTEIEEEIEEEEIPETIDDPAILERNINLLPKEEEEEEESSSSSDGEEVIVSRIKATRRSINVEESEEIKKMFDEH